jgi:copper homeostasis protein (lipoprotein)
MRYGRLILCAGIALLALTACAKRPEDPRRAVPAGAGALQASLVGTWVRPIPGRGSGQEGIVLDADGSFALIGIHTMNGLTWRLEGETLILTTDTQRYPQPQEGRLRVVQVSQGSLSLQADANYLGGTYTRNDAAAEVVSGTVTYRQSVTLPPDAAIYLELREVSVGRTGRLIANQTLPTLGRQVPIPFRIYYATAEINPSFTYSVGATIIVDGERRFATDVPNRVLTGGRPKTIAIVVVPPVEPEGPPPTPRSGRSPASPIDAPATYTGVVGCRACAGSRLTLTLRSDGIFFLRDARPRGGGGPAEVRQDLGRWRVAEGSRSLLLSSGTEPPRRFAIVDARTLRLLDSRGGEIASPGQYDILLAPEVDPFPEALPLRGMYETVGSTGFLTECLTGRRFPVYPGAGNAALEHAYTAARPDPEQSLLVSVEGRLARRPRTDGRGSQEVIVVDRFVDLRPAERCTFAQASATLEDTYWRLVELDGKTLAAGPDRRDASLQLLTAAHGLEGFAGCNEFSGTYELAGDRLRVIRLETTRATCRERMEEERAFLRLLRSEPACKVSGENLTLSEGGTVRARFESVYPR